MASLEPPLDSKLLVNGEISPEWWEWFSEIARPGGGVGGFQPSNVLGTTNQIDRSDDGTNVTLSLPSTIIAPGTIETTGDATVNGDVIVTGTVDGIDIATDVAANTLKATNVTTNLSTTQTTTTVDVVSSDGTDATLPQAIAGGNAGVLAGADQTKLDNTSGTNTGDEATASVTVSGISELATTVETDAGSATDRVVTPASLTNIISDVLANTAKATNVSTNLSTTQTTTTVDVVSSDGTDATLPQAIAGGNAGVLAGADQTKLDNTSGTNTGDEATATTTVSGISELATTAETDAGTATDRAVTPASLTNIIADVSTNTTHSSSDGKDHSDVVLNNTHRTSDGSDHSFIDQDVTTTGSPTFDDLDLTGDLLVDGNVGIGIAISSSLLKVNGNIHSNTYTINTDTIAGVGVALADANIAELGPGYLSLSRDDTAAAKQLLFTKNGALHSGISTDTNGFNIFGSDGAADVTVDGSGDFGIGTATPAEKLDVVGNAQITGNITPGTDDTYDVGSASFRWDDIYATNGTIQTSDRNEKENILSTDLGLEFINQLTPKKYSRIGGKRTHYGLIAQDVEEVLKGKDFAGHIKITYKVEETGKEKTRHGLRYDEFIAPMIKAIQELSEQVAQLKAAV